MIPRYETPQIADIWSEQARYETFLKVELAILRAFEGEIIPPGTADQIEKSAVINPQRINEIEATTKHDVIAFSTSITENLPSEIAKYFHFGVTSSDILDSTLTIQIKASLDVILPTFATLLRTLHTRAKETKDIICMGRSHGMYAEPMSFGQKIISHYNEFSRRYQDLKNFYDNELTVQFSGAVGNYTIITPKIEARAAESLNLKVEPLSTQVIPRDRIAKMVYLNSLTASAIERLAVEIRHLHSSDVREVQEGFSKGQKGSSIMPHKKNPISGENLTGMARIIRSHASIASDNIVLWHERDISHSSTERMYLPDHFGILYYALKRLGSTVEQLVINKEIIEGKVMDSCDYLSSYFLHHLIVNTDLRRESLYPILQEASFKSQQEDAKNKVDVFYQTLNSLLDSKGIDIKIDYPSFKKIKQIYLGNADEVFARSEKTYPLP